jgi:predicted amidohydrolase
MQDLKLTLVQIDQIWEDKAFNYSKYEHIFQNLDDTELIVLPEMFNTAFTMNVAELAEDWNHSTGIEFLKNWGKKLNTAFYTSLIVKDNDRYFNRGVFVFPDGQIEYYDKRKSFGLAGEDRFFTAGKEEKIVNYRGWKINLQICYDLRFPELIRNRMVNNNEAAYDLLIYVANWPEKRKYHWTSLLTARAIENQCYVVGLNRVGLDGKELNYSGNSAAFSPLGEKLCEENDFAECILNVDLSHNSLIEIRKSLPFLKDA